MDKNHKNEHHQMDDILPHSYRFHFGVLHFSNKHPVTATIELSPARFSLTVSSLSLYFEPATTSTYHFNALSKIIAADTFYVDARAKTNFKFCFSLCFLFHQAIAPGITVSFILIENDIFYGEFN